MRDCIVETDGVPDDVIFREKGVAMDALLT